MLVELSVMEQRYHAVMEVVSGAPMRCRGTQIYSHLKAAASGEVRANVGRRETG